MRLLDAHHPRPFLLTVAVALLAVAWSWRSVAAEDAATDTAETPTIEPYEFPDEFLERMAALPVQEGGRIKPFSTWAGVTLLQLRARRSMTTSDGRKLGPVAWGLEALFFPERAVTDQVFLIEDDQLLADLAIEVEKKKKRDRYSYNDLRPRLQFLRDKVQRVARLISQGRMRSADVTLLQMQERVLLGNVQTFESMLHALDVVRQPVDVSRIEDEPKWFSGSKQVSLVEAFARMPALLQEVQARNGDLKEGDPIPPDVEAFTRVTAEISVELSKVGSGSTTFSVLPQDQDPEVAPRWLAPANIGVASHLDPLRWGPEERKLYEPIRTAIAAQLMHLQAAVESRADRKAFMTHMDAFKDSVVRVAEKRNEFDRVGMEVSYYAFEPFFKALLGFIFAFVLLAFTWFSARGQKLYRVAVGLAVVSLLLVIAGITWRGIIRQKPPVTTLYDTIPFITAACVLACMVIEWINRQRIAIVLGIVLGAAGMWLESRYQYIHRKDTMPELEAVLRTNFWLWVHVTTVTIGYAAGLLAAALAHVYVLGRVFGAKSGDPGFYRSVSRMIYGTICFGLLFSVFGTIAGGIWANDSWGRFWGWDPKENGALLICLWEVAILHARMGGYIKSFGLAMAGVFTAPVVSFSWWGVNELGIGLHQYGKIDGVWTSLVIFWVFEAAVLAAGMTWWLQRRGATKHAA